MMMKVVIKFMMRKLHADLPMRPQCITSAYHKYLLACLQWLSTGFGFIIIIIFIIIVHTSSNFYVNIHDAVYDNDDSQLRQCNVK